MPSGSAADLRPVFAATATLIFVFVCLCAALLVGLPGSMSVKDLRPLDFVLLGFACLRLIHLVTYDKILEPLRERLENGRGFTRLTSDFVSCLWCTGIWSAVLVVTIHLLGSWGQLAVWVLAVAGLGSMLQVISRVIAGCAIEPRK
jgi:hypothetical protein